MEIPLYQLFYEGERPPDLPNLTQRKSTDELAMEIPADRDSRFFQKVKRLLGISTTATGGFCCTWHRN